MIEINQVIGRHYKILARLGAGGMGQVFRALDLNLNREVAVKFLLDDMSDNQELSARFLNEGRILATIHHRSVVAVYASDKDEALNATFLVMEFFDGVSIDKRREDYLKNPLTLIRHFIDLLDGIHACHQKGIIHRDIKPGNILVNIDGRLRIVDFGIAKIAKKQTRTGVALGTPHYMSPEQCLGKGEITAKADIYSIGVMLWEFLTGTLPFDCGSGADDPALAIALMHLNEPPPLEKLDDTPLGKRFRDMLSKMLGKKPADRPEIPAIIEFLQGEARRLEFPDDRTGGKGSPFTLGNLVNEVYRLETVLGEGGMGKVFKANDTSLNRTVALKVLTLDASQDPTIIERFIREGQLLATVGHPNVVGIYASSYEKRTGQPFLVQEFIDGVPLASLKPTLLKDRAKVVPLVLQLLEGIAACHAKGVLHRDLKPSNIFVTRDGLLKILDFGIAKTSINLTKTGLTIGTPEYMSPEQCLGAPLTPKSDVYSLGIVFWELLYGSPPFRGQGKEGPNQALAVASQQIEATLPAQVVIPDESIIPLLPLVRRMLDKNPDARPTPEEAIDLLEEYLESHPPATDDASRRRSKIRRTSQVRTILEEHQAPSRKKEIVTALVVLLTVVLAGWWYFGRRSARPPEVIEAEVRAFIKAGDFDRAARSLAALERATNAGSVTLFLRTEISGRFQADSMAALQAGRDEEAGKLLERAIRADPGNASASLQLNSLLVRIREKEARQERRKDLARQAEGLVSLVTPASGTGALVAILAEMTGEGLATEVASIQSRWVDRFTSEGNTRIASEPRQALAWFQEIQTRFPQTPGLSDRVRAAQDRITRLEQESASEAERAKAAAVIASLTAEIETGLASFRAAGDPAPLLTRIELLSRKAGPGTAEPLRTRLADVFWTEAETLAGSDKPAAMATLRRAAGFFPQDKRFPDRLKALTEEAALAAGQAEREKNLAALRAAIKGKLETLTPPQPVTPLLADLTRLETEFNLGSEAADARAVLLARYRVQAALARADDPRKAIQILQACLPIATEPAALQSEIEGLQGELASAAVAEGAKKQVQNLKVKALALASAPLGKDAARLATHLGELEKLGAAPEAGEVRKAAMAVLEAKAAAVKSAADFDPLIEAASKIFPAGSPEAVELQGLKEQYVARKKGDRVAQIRKAVGAYQPGSPAKPLSGIFKELQALGEETTATELTGLLRKKITDAAREIAPRDPGQAEAQVREGLNFPPLKDDPGLKALLKEVQEAARTAATQRRNEVVGKLEAAVASPQMSEQLDAITGLLSSLEQEPDGKTVAAPFRKRVGDQLAAAAKAALEAGELPRSRQLCDRLRTFAPRHPELAALAMGIDKASKPPLPPVKATEPTDLPPKPPEPPVEPPKAPTELIVTPGGSPTLAEAVSQATPGMTVKIRPGKHAAGLSIDKAITLAGEGDASTIVLEASDRPVLTLSGKVAITNLSISFKGSSQIDAVKVTGGSPSIKNCTITSSAAAGPPDWSGCIGVYGGSPVIQGNGLLRSRGMGLLVRGGKPTVVGNTMEGNAIYGAWFSDGAGGTFTNNTITRSGKSGVGVKGGSTPLIKGNTVRDNTESGIFVYQAGAGAIQQNNLAQNGKAGIEVGLGGKPDRIDGNTISGNSSHGIHVHGSGSQARIGTNSFNGNRGKTEQSENGGTITHN